MTVERKSIWAILILKLVILFCFFSLKYVTSGDAVDTAIFPDIAGGRASVNHCVAIDVQDLDGSPTLFWTDRYCSDKYSFVCQTKSLAEILAGWSTGQLETFQKNPKKNSKFKKYQKKFVIFFTILYRVKKNFTVRTFYDSMTNIWPMHFFLLYGF